MSVDQTFFLCTFHQAHSSNKSLFVLAESVSQLIMSKIGGPSMKKKGGLAISKLDDILDASKKMIESNVNFIKVCKKSKQRMIW